MILTDLVEVASFASTDKIQMTINTCFMGVVGLGLLIGIKILSVSILWTARCRLRSLLRVVER